MFTKSVKRNKIKYLPKKKVSLFDKTYKYTFTPQSLYHKGFCLSTGIVGGFSVEKLQKTLPFLQKTFGFSTFIVFYFVLLKVFYMFSTIFSTPKFQVYRQFQVVFYKYLELTTTIIYIYIFRFSLLEREREYKKFHNLHILSAFFLQKTDN